MNKFRKGADLPGEADTTCSAAPEAELPRQSGVANQARS